MSLLALLRNNIDWADRMISRDPMFFERLRGQQSPAYLWIGCSDSRVPANEIVGLAPGELFVHRNVANLVVHTDLNCLTVLQYAIDVLRVRHVIVTGHYGCGGVQAVLEGARLGLIDNWLRNVETIRQRHSEVLGQLSRDTALDRLCELNVIHQARNLCETTIVQDAWARGQAVGVHGLIYGLGDGRLREVGFTAAAPQDIEASYRQAIQAHPGRANR